MEIEGFEPSASAMRMQRSSQLSYIPRQAKVMSDNQKVGSCAPTQALFCKTCLFLLSQYAKSRCARTIY